MLTIPWTILCCLRMVEDFSITLHAGGRYLCSPAWGRLSGRTDQCYKIYLPLSGKAYISDANREFDLIPGNVYFISGYAQKSQRCQTRMDVKWLHFTPVSFYLHRCLQSLPLLHAWPATSVPWVAQTLGRVENLFENPNSETESLPDKQIPISQTCRMKAALMQLVADLLEAREGGPDEAPHPGLERLRPAIRYMDEHFQENPTLSQLAASVHLAPTYFHRLFRNAMATTPFAYITARRMETARHLLSNNDLPIKQVADKCGYDDPFYFSRTFLKHYGISPSQTRKRGLPGA